MDHGKYLVGWESGGNETGNERGDSERGDSERDRTAQEGTTEKNERAEMPRGGGRQAHCLVAS